MSRINDMAKYLNEYDDGTYANSLNRLFGGIEVWELYPIVEKVEKNIPLTVDEDSILKKYAEEAGFQE